MAGAQGIAFGAYLRHEVDLINVMNALRLAEAGAFREQPDRSFFIRGGLRVSEGKWVHLASLES